MAVNSSPLEELLVSKSELDENLLKDVLKPFIKIENETGEYIFTPKFSDLTLRQKIIVILLGQKAKVRLNLTQKEEVRPKDLEYLLGEKGNSIRPALKELRRKGLISYGKDGYFIHNALIYKAKNYLLASEKK